VFVWLVVGDYCMPRGAYVGNDEPLPPLIVVGREYGIRGRVEGGVLFSIVGLAFT
jgi:hypothetical protein